MKEELDGPGLDVFAKQANKARFCWDAPDKMCLWWLQKCLICNFISKEFATSNGETSQNNKEEDS